LKLDSSWRALVRRFADERGAVATEYALLLIFIAVAIVAAASAFGLALANKYAEACVPLGASC
jgi:Flp pilus assembly pilin Flp